MEVQKMCDTITEKEKETPYCRNYNCEQCDNFCTKGMISFCLNVNVTADLFYECRLKKCACKYFVQWQTVEQEQEEEE